MLKKIQALRPLVRAMVLVAVALAAAPLLLRLFPHGPLSNLPWSIDPTPVGVGISLLLLAIVLVLATRLERSFDRLVEVREELVRSREQLQDAIDALPAGVELYGPDDRLQMVNRTNREMYPQLADLADQRPTFEEVVRTNASRGGLPLLKTVEELDAWIERRQGERRNPPDVAVHQIAEDRWIRTHERRLRDGGLVAIRLDVSELMRTQRELNALNDRLADANRELSVQSHTDALTGLANRREFDRRLAEEFSRAVRHALPLTLLILDIDHFKLYNDHYGHLAGDACLREVATLLRECASRPSDLVARLGGEEFALLLPHQAGGQAWQVAQRCLQAIETARIAHAASPVAAHVTASIGAAEWSDGMQDAEALLKAADEALYAAKRQGRRRVELGGSSTPHWT